MTTGVAHMRAQAVDQKRNNIKAAEQGNIKPHKWQKLVNLFF